MNPGNHRATIPRYSAIGRLYEWAEAADAVPFSFFNLQPSPGKFIPATIDTEYAESIITYHVGPIVALGSAVSRVLAKMGVAHATVPHPSYRNRVLNDPEASSSAIKTIERLMSE